LIDNLQNSIEDIEFDCYYNLELNNLQNSIKIISFDPNSYFDKELNNLPHFLEKIFLPIKYNKEIKNINSQC